MQTIMGILAMFFFYGVIASNTWIIPVMVSIPMIIIGYQLFMIGRGKAKLRKLGREVL